MARLVGFIANRPDLGARVIELEGDSLRVRPRSDLPTGWGVGFYQAGEILLRRRPVDDRRELSIADMTRDIRAEVLLAHVRLATVGSPRTENTHPFRFRQWLFAATGTADRFTAIASRLSESLPLFLQRNVRGETDSELLFHLFLSFLHDAGELDRPHVGPEATRAALSSSVAVLDRLIAEEGGAPSRLNILISNPEYLLAANGGAPMAYRVFQGQRDVVRLLGEGDLSRMRMPDYASARLTLVASDFEDEPPPGWTVLAPRSVLICSRTDESRFESF